VGYESWLERDRLMLLDFDPLVTGMASQPFRLSWTSTKGQRVRHTPDFFVRRAVDAALLLARAMTPEAIRPGWADALRMPRSVLPHASLMALDERLANAAAVPVITPETIVCDRGKAYISDTFRSACQSLGISFQPAHPDTPTDKPHVERTLESVASMFVQHLPGHKGRSTEHRGTDPATEAVWTIHQLQELLQE
jgi:hypothetical protein